MGLTAEARGLLDALMERRPLPRLAPAEVWDRDIDRRLAQLAESAAFDEGVAEPSFARATLSGLNLLNDNLDMAHRLAMSGSVSAPVARSTLDFWHGIMHRREADYANSKYWFHRVGDHTIFPEVHRRAQDVLRQAGSPAVNGIRSALERPAAWDPFVFIDLCARHEEHEGSGRDLLRSIQAGEIGALLEFCIAQAGGDD